jgi:hypothetical protein
VLVTYLSRVVLGVSSRWMLWRVARVSRWSRPKTRSWSGSSSWNNRSASARRTHRRVNYGLLVAAVAFAVSLVWLAGAFAIGRAELLHAQQHRTAAAVSS